jgi:hypothetical protein
MIAKNKLESNEKKQRFRKKRKNNPYMINEAII